jgi:AraC-like DNA-binding protein
LAVGGINFTRLGNGERLVRAVHLLASSDMKITDVAHGLGYSDHAHFTRAFRRWTGMPPRAFRRRARSLRRVGRRGGQRRPLPVEGSAAKIRL